MSLRRRLLPLVLAPLLTGAWLTSPAAAATGPCANQQAIQVPGAAKQRTECEADLSARTLGALGLSDPSDWATLSSARSTNPPAGAGIQVDGYFPDDSTTNTENGWNHDSQFVIRLPARWNGQLVVTGAPGVRKQFAPDYIISDWVLSQGYAYASTDKGNTGTSFFNNGSRSKPGQAVQEWNYRVTQLTVAAKKVVTQRYGRAPGADVDDRDLQRRLPHALAVGEPALALRRRRRLGGHAVHPQRAQPLHLPPHRVARVPAGADRSRRARGDVRRRLRSGFGGALARPLRRVLGPDPADVPGGVRPHLRRRHPGRDPVLPRRGPARQRHRLRRAVRLRVAPPGREGRRRLGVADRTDRQAADHPAR